jgi:hemerythrin superfamily protein
MATRAVSAGHPHPETVMTILNALKADHDEFKDMLKAILVTKDGKKRGDLFAEFKTELTAHSRAEEKIFYRALEKTHEGKTEVLEGTIEHDIVDRLLAELASAQRPEAEKWTARCTVLQELLEHHIEEEEDDFFKTARKLFDRAALEQMGKDFAAEKSKVGASTHSAAAAE